MVTNIIVVRCHNKFFDGSKDHHTKRGFANTQRAKKFEKIRFTVIVKIIRKDLRNSKFKK